MEDNVVVVVAFDKNTGYTKTVTSCDIERSQHYARYYRGIGYNARVMTYEKLKQILEQEMREKMYNVRLSKML